MPKDNPSRTAPPPDEGRRRGRPRQIDRGAIVAAAREIPASHLTMQAVADRLGVSRRAVGYHVAGIEEIQRLVAAADLTDGLTQVALPHGDWRAAITCYAATLRRILLLNPAAATVLSEIPLAGPLALIEHLVDELVSAGMDLALAARAVELVNDATLAAARRTIATQQLGHYPLADDALAVVRRDAESYTRLAQLIALAQANATVDGDPPDNAEDPQFAIEVIIAGLAHLQASDQR